MTQQRPSTSATTPAAASPRFAPTLLARSLQAAFAVIAATAVVGAARANPQGGVVVGGQATISQPSPALTTIQQSSQRAVIDWRSFSIGGSEAVRFNQPGPTAATLNRVIGNEPSNLLGSLSANGRVYLVNQNGVFIGPNAQLDAAALVLSTANISNSDFMAGKLKFDQPGRAGAKIINEGRITAADGGLVAMVAPGVENRGVISARLGQVVLAGAPAFSLDLFGDGMVNIVLSQQGMQTLTDAAGKPLANYVDTSGRITAEGGRIWIEAAQARGIVDSMVNIGGELRATRVAQRGGEITLLGGDRLAVSGSVIATDAAGVGGTIGASADHIALAAGARLDASGTAGGGAVRVGGGYQGRSTVPGAQGNARTLDVAEGAEIRADATVHGNGGQVVLWSDEATRFSGSASARAGGLGGDGGLIEVSGKKRLAFDGRADASAANGKAGALLLDPGSLTVADQGSGGFTAAGSDSTVGAETLNQVLRGGTSVTLQADDDIVIASVIDGRPLTGSGGAWAGAGLTLDAGRNVSVNQYVVLAGGAFSSTSRGGSFTQAADTGIVSLAADGRLGAGAISVQASGPVRTQYLLTQGGVTLQSSGGAVEASRSIGGSFAGAPAPVQSLNVTAGTGISLAAGAAASGDIVLNAGGAAQLGPLDAGGRLDVQAASVAAAGGLRAAQGVELLARTGNLDLAGVESGSGILRGSATLGNITTQDGSTLLARGGQLTLQAGGSVTARGALAANDPQNYRTSSVAGNVGVTAGGDVTVNELVARGAVDITSTGGAVTLARSVGGTDSTAPSVGALRLSAWGDITLSGLNLTGAAEGTTGLSVRAGRRLDGGNNEVLNPGGGRIAVNERIGVGSGNLEFGPANPTSNSNYQITLAQGVYARSGASSITFNAPVVTSEQSILSAWRSALQVGSLQFATAPTLSAGQQTALQNGDLLQDMLLIPVQLNNDNARQLVEAGGGLRVVYQAGAISAVCASTACVGATPETQYWLVPKIVVSNQEPAAQASSGSITFNGGVRLGTVASGPAQGLTSSALKVIVPASATERVVSTYNNIPGYLANLMGKVRFDIFGGNVEAVANTGNTEFRTNPPVSLALDNLSATGSSLLGYSAYIYLVPTATDLQRNNIASIVYSDALITAPVTSATPTVSALPIQVTMFPGALSREGVGASSSVPDSGTILPSSGTFSFNSSSNPSGFAPIGGSGTTLGQQVLAAVIPAQPATATGNGGNGGGAGTGGGTATGGSGTGVGTGTGGTSGSGGSGTVVTTGLTTVRDSSSSADPNVVIAASAMARDATEREAGAGCGGGDRIVVGRGRADEADGGAMPALRGAPPPVFRTRYVLGAVSPSLPAADRSSIGSGDSGGGSSSTCQ